MPLIVSNNAAGRLHALVVKARSLPENLRTGPAIRVLPEVLGISKETPRPDVMRMLGEFLELPSTVEAEILRQPDINPSLYLSWVPGAKGAFQSNNLDNGMNAFFGPFDPNTMALIAICDDILRRLHVEPEIEREAAEKLLKDTRSLIAEVIKADIDAQIRDFVLRHLYIVERAIIESQYFGMRALTRGLEVSLGASIVRSQEAKTVAATPTGKMLLAILGAYVLLCNSINSTVQLPGNLKNLYLLIDPKTPPSAATPDSQHHPKEPEHAHK